MCLLIFVKRLVTLYGRFPFDDIYSTSLPICTVEVISSILNLFVDIYYQALVMLYCNAHLCY